MTRELLLENICPTDCTDDCVILGCDYCNVKLNELLDEYDKQIRAEAINDYYKKLNEKINTDTNLKDTIREIHDNVAQEMYCKGVDDMVGNLIANSRTEIIDGKLMFIVTEERIKTVANEMKKRLDS